ncbi:MAG TPA: pyridoxamine 5'-phosphate oxidase family protein [Candidatus Bathyarchaeia archaeon]|nr:pyridoxamine 5'-phosphate oxidase family protein [Candidatus Bathyarchaeia archaeon]
MNPVVKERIKFNRKEQHLLESHDVCRLATAGRDGWPHCVPVGYTYRSGLFHIPANKKSRKVLNLQENPRSCIVIDDEEENVLMIQCHTDIVKGKRLIALRKSMETKTGWRIGDNSVILVLTPVRKAAWKPD